MTLNPKAKMTVCTRIDQAELILFPILDIRTIHSRLYRSTVIPIGAYTCFACKDGQGIVGVGGYFGVGSLAVYEYRLWLGWAYRGLDIVDAKGAFVVPVG